MENLSENDVRELELADKYIRRAAELEREADLRARILGTMEKEASRNRFVESTRADKLLLIGFVFGFGFAAALFFIAKWV